MAVKRGSSGALRVRAPQTRATKAGTYRLRISATTSRWESHRPEGRRVLADGARTNSLGEHNWKILKRSMKRIVEVPEEKIAEAVRLLFELANLKAEPTGALSVAAVLTQPLLFRDRRV